jgi:hypothetical protein
MIHWPLRCFHAAWRTLWKEWDWLVEDSSRIPCISMLPRFGGRHAACAISAGSLRTERSLSEGVPRREDGQIERCRVVQETKKLSGTEGRIGRQQRSVILPLEPRNRGYNWDGESRQRKTDRHHASAKKWSKILRQDRDRLTFLFTICLQLKPLC